MLTLSVMILSLLPMFGAKEFAIAPGEETKIDYTLAEDVEDEVPLNLWAYVKADNANLRETPGTNGKLTGKAQWGVRQGWVLDGIIAATGLIQRHRACDIRSGIGPNEGPVILCWLSLGDRQITVSFQGITS